MSQVLEVAAEVRQWAERIALKYKYPKDLNRLCGISSRKLYRELVKAGLKPRIVFSFAHAFVTVPDLGVLIDVTATQYGRRPVEVRQAKKIRVGYWKPQRIFFTEGSFRSWQNNTGWCYCEIVPQVCVFHAEEN